MKTSDFNFELPEELIAQDPLEDRSASRLMVADRYQMDFTHDHFYNIKNYLRKGDCLVLNNTKVIPARLIGEKKDTGGKVELLLLKRRENDIWETLVKPGKKARPGAQIVFGDGILCATVLDVVEEGNRLVQFSYDGIFEEVLDRLGQMPLPPYITHQLKDKNRYQTVYAKYEGSAAAPTAGLHFTNTLLKEIEEMGVTIANVTLHVGLGTFRPVKVDDVTNHHMHSEFYQILPSEAEKINETRKRGDRVICVGTTSLRTVESAADMFGNVQAGEDNTEIFIYPGYRVRVADALITNFHLPESTLIMLVSALTGKDKILKGYQEAIARRYRFFSFGDCSMVANSRLLYNSDGTYNAKYYNAQGELIVPIDEFAKIEEDYISKIKQCKSEEDFAKLWDAHHDSAYSYEFCKEWCKTNSANHRF
ncbi:MAG: tRNA preQ1(34) S-adenosylmethionine ribosyltransferase-isomerase QueA [Lachnospiraceae bacterium]|nr:tRNA preQ1(34) S-adenosylmethionine ribosyltransferase-isomerase QueA [Lachnospiraceae bacterium]